MVQLNTPRDKDDLPPYIICKSNWLPAIGLYGEGIFFTLDENALQRWEKHPKLVQRAETTKTRYDQALVSVADNDVKVTPRFLLLHTLAHILIRQLESEAGYPAASLNERIYCRDGKEPMAGILIYVAVPDIAGSLGGVTEENSSIQDLKNKLLKDKVDIELKDNYRNTYPIARLAQEFYTGPPPPPGLPTRPSIEKPLLVEYGDGCKFDFATIVGHLLKRADREPGKLTGVITPNNKVRDRYLEALRGTEVHLDNGMPRIETYASALRSPPRCTPLRELLTPGVKGWTLKQREAALLLARESKWDFVYTKISLGKGDYQLVIDGSGAHILLPGEVKAVETEVDMKQFFKRLPEVKITGKTDRKIREVLSR